MALECFVAKSATQPSVPSVAAAGELWEAVEMEVVWGACEAAIKTAIML